MTDGVSPYSLPVHSRHIACLQGCRQPAEAVTGPGGGDSGHAAGRQVRPQLWHPGVWGPLAGLPFGSPTALLDVPVSGCPP